MLRLGGASQDALRYAKLWTCAVCAQMQAPRLTRKAMLLPDEMAFNAVVGLDLLTVHDTNQKEYVCLSMVDWASRYHVTILMKTKSSAETARKFCKYWVRWAGTPERLQYDRGGEFEGKFESMMDRLNVDSYTVLVEAPWQNGLVERQGGVLKNLVDSIVQETQATSKEDMEYVLLEACLAKNQLIRRHGFSPIQHVLGQDIRLPASVLERPGDIASHSGAVQDSLFQRRLNMRQAARMAWAKLDNSTRLRRALVSNEHPMRGPYVAGMQVYFWKIAGQSKTMR